MDKMNGTTLLLAKLLGELYRLQRAFDNVACPAGPSRIYGLLNGFETEIREELEQIGFVSRDELKAVMDVLEPYWGQPEELEKFKGFYDIENDLKKRGIDRGKAITILKFLNANGQFEGVIAKMDSSNSPTECRRFELNMWDA